MPDLELTRSPNDRRLYELEGVGSLRLGGWFSRSATAQADGDRLQLSRRSLLRTAIQATDSSGAVQGEFTGRTWRRGGELRWSGRSLELRSSSMWRERYALVEDERELVTIEGKGWGKRPVKVTIEDRTAAIDPGLLLLAVFVVRALAEDAGAAAGATAGAAGVAGT